jgi:hypothetical protein
VISILEFRILKKKDIQAFRHRYFKKYLLPPPDRPTYHPEGEEGKPEIKFDM